MRIKKFTGATMQDAVERLRQEFGPDAVILQTAQKRPWFFGRLGRKKYEVIGAVDPTFKSGGKAKKQERKPNNGNKMPDIDPAWTSSIQKLFQRLVNSDLPRDLAQQLLKDALSRLPREEWNDLNKVWNQLFSAVVEMLDTVEPWEFRGGQQVVALIGPTGVGKTTTIAKLAASFALIDKKKVGVVTVDTYRIAAAEQLKTYADIIGIPVRVAYSPGELKDALAKMQDRDLILIDTAGRSQNNRLQVGELKSYLEGLDVEIHLVISATTKQSDAKEIIEAFSLLEFDRLIITKLDETNAPGIVLYAAQNARAPIAFLTAGQGVPEDIEVADREKIAQLILGDF
ncbi:MAG: flagellar biosynthesis protein FlhF [Firmicutes bacterium]|nr:flagellar biosynthesis protein FlhF [Bacillota bacterium]